MITYHVTKDIDNYKSILKDRFIKACRLKNVYLFKSLKDAENYKKEFNGYYIFEVSIITKQIQTRWYPSYAKDGVIKLKENEIVGINESAKIQLF